MQLRPLILLVVAVWISLSEVSFAREKTFEEIVNAPLVYSLPGMKDARIVADIRYSNVNDPNLLMDVYTPKGIKKNEQLPVVMFIHGGAGSDSRAKDWGIYRDWGRLAAAAGFVGVTFNHRLGFPDPLLDESAADVDAAIEYVRANAKKLGADGDRICLAAYSAGGPMLTLGVQDSRPHIRCLIAFYAFLDIQQSQLHSDHEPIEKVKAFSLIEHLTKPRARNIPMFIARAGLDEIPTMNDSIDRFLQRAIQQNANVTVMNHPEGVHTFDNQNDDDRSREIIAAALAFLKQHLN